MRILNSYHPISIAIILIRLALVLSFFLIKLRASWLGFIIALVFLGGVIVVLIFSVSICGNEKIIFSNKINIVILIPSIFLSRRMFLRRDLKGGQVANSLYQIDQIWGLSFIVFLLLLCIISRVKIVQLDFGPLVKRL